MQQQVKLVENREQELTRALPHVKWRDATIVLDTRWPRIAVNVSGGADSALLCYILAQLTRAEIVVINYRRMYRTRPWQLHVYQQVFEELKRLCPKTKFREVEHYVAPELEGYEMTIPGKTARGAEMIVQGSFNYYIAEELGISAVYNATTSNPPHRLAHEIAERTRQLSEVTSDDLAHYGKKNTWLIKPLLLRDKSWIVGEYKRLGLISLYAKTRSCEGEFADITYETYTPGQYVPKCGRCFWCRERAWAEQETMAKL